jgi:hypothetical protein
VMEVRDPNNPEEIIQVEDKDKIWYDPFDISLDEFSSFEFVFNAYKEAGGQLSEDAFRNTFAKVDLSSYYTKIEVDKIKQDLEKLIQDTSSMVWKDVIN